MPALYKHKSALASRPSKSKPQAPQKPPKKNEMDTSAVEEPTWSTTPIMDTETKEKQPKQRDQVVPKASLNQLKPNYGGMKNKKVMSKKMKARKEVALQKALAFKDQLEGKLAKQKAKR